MTGPVDDRLVLGAYALFAGVPVDDLGGAYRSLAELTMIGALEIPLADALGENAGLGSMRRGLPGVVADKWDLVITCVPTVMGRLGVEPTYGLASVHPDGREAAVADVRRALEVAREAAQHSGRRRVRAIEVHSAPRRAAASPAAFRAIPGGTARRRCGRRGAGRRALRRDASRPAARRRGSSRSARSWQSSGHR